MARDAANHEAIIIERAKRGHAKRFGRLSRLDGRICSGWSHRLPGKTCHYPRRFIRISDTISGATTDWAFHRGGRLRILAEREPSE